MPSLGKGGGASADPSRTFGGGLGLFLNGQGSFGDQQTTSREPGFAFHTAGLTAGGDYRLTNNLILGGAFGYLNTKADLDDSAGHLTTNGYSLSAYGTYFVADKIYFDGIATFGWNKYDTDRNITFSDTSATAKGNTDGNQFAFSVNGGYNFTFGPLTVGPSLRVNYIRVHIDSFQERGADIFNLKVDSQKVESLATDLGGQASYAISMPWGVLLPLVRFEWEHEYKGGSRLITGSLVADPVHTSFAAPTNDPDRNYFNLGAGITATLKRGASAFFYYEAVLGRDHVTNHSFNAGVRYQFE
jgi:outer membrane autotransporter protein